MAPLLADGEGGVSIATARGGSGAPSAFFVHATGFCKELWSPVVDRIETAPFSWISMDLRGHGSSVSGEASYEWDLVGQDIHRVLGTQSVPIGVGHSCGAAAMVRCEAQNPGTFDRLVLIEPIMFPPPFQPLDGPMSAVALKRRSVFVSRQDARQRFSTGPFSTWTADALDAYLDGGFRDTSNGFELVCTPEVEAEYYRQGSNHDTWLLAAELDLPVALIVGEHSNTHRGTYLTALTEQFGDIDLHVVAGSGHLVPMENPGAIAALVDAALSQVASAA